MTDQRPLIIYHASCWDGFCAAWLLSTSAPWSEAEWHPARYGEEPPPVAGREVAILDFSYPRQVLERLHEDAIYLVVLDHHKTAAKDLEGLDYCTFDMEKSGARLTWEYLNGFPVLPKPSPIPWIIDYTEDRDLWRHALPDTREINAAIRSYPLTVDTFDVIFCAQPRDFVAVGRGILRREQQIVDHHVKRAAPLELDGHAGRVVNATVLLSEIAGTIAEGHAFGACWYERGGRRQWELRSRDGGVDVSEIAKVRGGGGHVHAAGYEEAAEIEPAP